MELAKATGALVPLSVEMTGQVMIINVQPDRARPRLSDPPG